MQCKEIFDGGDCDSCYMKDFKYIICVTCYICACVYSNICYISIGDEDKDDFRY